MRAAGGVEEHRHVAGRRVRASSELRDGLRIEDGQGRLGDRSQAGGVRDAELDRVGDAARQARDDAAPLHERVGGRAGDIAEVVVVVQVPADRDRVAAARVRVARVARELQVAAGLDDIGVAREGGRRRVGHGVHHDLSRGGLVDADAVDQAQGRGEGARAHVLGGVVLIENRVGAAGHKALCRRRVEVARAVDEGVRVPPEAVARVHVPLDRVDGGVRVRMERLVVDEVDLAVIAAGAARIDDRLGDARDGDGLGVEEHGGEDERTHGSAHGARAPVARDGRCVAVIVPDVAEAAVARHAVAVVHVTHHRADIIDAELAVPVTPADRRGRGRRRAVGLLVRVDTVGVAAARLRVDAVPIAA